jgi:lytic cellulose monooxygenase (C1-hydroxylating)
MVPRTLNSSPFRTHVPDWLLFSYPGWSPADRSSPGVKRIEWGFPAQNTVGVGPVLDVTSADIACRKGATTPALVAPMRAGAEIKFQWTNYFTSHKGPVLTVIVLVADNFRSLC